MGKKITLEIREDLAEELTALEQKALEKVIEEGLKAYRQGIWRDRLEDYLPYMKTDDVLAAAHEAKKEAYQLLIDQGIAEIALLFSDMLSELLHRKEDEKVIERVGEQS